MTSHKSLSFGHFPDSWIFMFLVSVGVPMSAGTNLLVALKARAVPERGRSERPVVEKPTRTTWHQLNGEADSLGLQPRFWASSEVRICVALRGFTVTGWIYASP